MKEFTKENDYVTYYGLEGGDCRLPPLICLHGMTGDSNSFLELAPLLKHHFHVMVLDLPGHGKTKPLRLEKEYTFTRLSRQLLSVIRSLTNRPFYILGHSWGADLALHIATLEPTQVQGIILIDGGYSFPEHVEDMTEKKALIGWQQYIDASTYRCWEDIIETYQNYTTRTWDAVLDSIISSNFSKGRDGYVLKADPFSLLAIIKAFFREPCSVVHGDVNCPVLFFHATLPLVDLSRMKGIKAIVKTVDTIETVGIPNTKHNIHWDSPDEVAKKIVRWKGREPV